MEKFAMVAIVGRPSAGKSSLMNHLCGQKIAIVTPCPQTTRNHVRGIMTEERGQIVFLDTPGFHQSDKRLNQRLGGLIMKSIGACDFILYVVDVSRGLPGAEETELLQILSTRTHRIIIAYNKIDRCPAKNVRRGVRRILRQHIEKAGVVTETPFGKEVEISVLANKGMDELRTALFDLAQEGVALYPPDCYTDQRPEFRIAEIIRERAMLRGKEELPHSIYVIVEDLEMQDGTRVSEFAPKNTYQHTFGQAKPALWVRAVIYVEYDSQIGLVVGRAGNGIKEITKESHREISRLFPYQIHLDIRVKCSHNWRRKSNIIANVIR